MPVAASRGAVPAGATAVVLNVTLVNAGGPTYFTIYPAGQPRPSVSSVNASGRAAVANLVTVGLATAAGVGSLDLYDAGAAADVVVDLEGYYRAGAGAGYVPITPCRAFDTRSGVRAACVNTPSRPAAELGPGTNRTERIAGLAGIPADAVAVTLNLTAVDATAHTYVTAYPAGRPTPLASNLNLASAAPVANLVTVALGAGGAITLHNRAGRLNLLADIAGYYRAGGGAQFTPVVPCRIYDTRTGHGSCLPGWGRDAGGALRANHYLPLALPGLIANVPVGATAVALNVTAVNAQATVVSAFPDSVAALPAVSNLDVRGPAPVANQVVVGLAPGDPVPSDPSNPVGKADIYSYSGSVDLVVDLAGFFS